MIPKIFSQENISKETLKAVLEREDGVSDITFDSDEFLKAHLRINGVLYHIQVDEAKIVIRFFTLFKLKDGINPVDALVLANAVNERVDIAHAVFLRDENLLLFLSCLPLTGGVELTNFLFTFGTFRELSSWVKEFDSEGIVE